MSLDKTSQGKRVWELFSERAMTELGEKSFQAIVGRFGVKVEFQIFWEGRWPYVQDETDEADAADEFWDIFHDRHVESQRGASGDGSGEEPSFASPMRTHGSIDSIAAYAEALPIVKEARSEILGSAEPLSVPEAIEWMKFRFGHGPRRAVYSLTCRFMAPDTIEACNAAIAGMAAGDGERLLKALEAASEPCELTKGLKYPEIVFDRRILAFQHDGTDYRFNLLHTEHREGVELVKWADRLADRCVGVSPSRAGSPPAGFDRAVWLILAGIWPRISTYSVLKSSRDQAWNPEPSTDRRQAPYVTMNVLALDVKPEDVAEAFRRLRKGTLYTRGGRKMTAEKEVLCISALEAVEIDGVSWGDPERFREAVLRRFRTNAEPYGIEPGVYTGVKAWKKAARALRSVEKSYRRLYSRSPWSPFPLRTESTPAAALERRLFSRMGDPGEHRS